jgi:hypothetical protein
MGSLAINPYRVHFLRWSPKTELPLISAVIFFGIGVEHASPFFQDLAARIPDVY